MTFVHETAIVSANAAIGHGCHIGPFCTVGDHVILGDGVRLDSHVVVDGHTSIGDETHVFPFASIGLAPQDLKYAGEPTQTTIGKRNQIREGVTIHRGTAGGSGITQMGDDNLLMAQAHVAHDCSLGSGIVMANAAALAGHVEVGDRSTVGAFTGVHQFCRIGVEAFVGSYSKVVKDPLPYSITQGNTATSFGINAVGLRRRGHSKETIANIKHAFHLLLNSKLNTTQAIERMREDIKNCPEVDYLIDFIETAKRGIAK